MPRRTKNLWPFSSFSKSTVYHLKGRQRGAVETTTGMYKGYRVYERRDLDGWTVPQLDRESVFDTKGDAKRFIDAMAKRSNPLLSRKRKRQIELEEYARVGRLPEWRKREIEKEERAKLKKVNPRTLIPAKIIIKGGKARVFVTQAAMQKLNPTVERTGKVKGASRGLKQMMTRRRRPAQVGAFGTHKNQRYLVGVSGSTGSYRYTAKLSTAKNKGIKLAKEYGTDKFFVQNQVTGSILQFGVKK